MNRSLEATERVTKLQRQMSVEASPHSPSPSMPKRSRTEGDAEDAKASSRSAKRSRLAELALRDGALREELFELLRAELPTDEARVAELDARFQAADRREQALLERERKLRAWEAALEERERRLRGTSSEAAPSDTPGHRALPCDHAKLWKCVSRLGSSRIQSLQEFERLLRPLCSKHAQEAMSLRGLSAALAIDNFHGKFFTRTLPFIIRTALELPRLRQKLPNEQLQIFKPSRQERSRQRLVLPRDVVASLVCNMFLCTFDYLHSKLAGHALLPKPGFHVIFGSNKDHEVAKLRMMLAYFDRLAREGLPNGSLTTDRICGTALTKEQWAASRERLLPLDLAPDKVGFESAPELAHVDFANKSIGGGVLAGGYVQEEIRFAMCPELLVLLLVCPVLGEGEVLQIAGAERYCSYRGYGLSLQYDGEYREQAATLPDGSIDNALLAMDAQDFRNADSGLQAQLQDPRILRDLNKSLAAFTPVDEASRKRFPVVATGNWGSGAFQGCPQLKALLQWASASRCGRSLRYFPFDQDFGPSLQELSRRAVAKGVTVGELVLAIDTLKRAEFLVERPETWRKVLLNVARILHLGADRSGGPVLSRAAAADS